MIKRTRQVVHLGLLLCFSLALGCAFDLVHVKYRPAHLDTAQKEGLSSFTVAADTPIQGAPCGNSRTLRKGTRWDAVGRVVAGGVYRSRDQILTIECSNVFEAYLVVNGNRLVGFYLPVEKAFSPLDEPVQMVVSYQRRQHQRRN